ncbi:MAG: NAAT family transporter [Bacteroidales bacterium]|nr:NAAT family transporter [Bacteroidales bacterium]
MHEYFTFGVLWFTAFFTILNPIGILPVFMTMTNSFTVVERRKTALKAVIIAFAILLGFAFLGEFLFKFFGISVNSFRVVGGIIFFLVGFDMLQARLTKTKISKNEVKEYSDDISITPLAIPMITGPGAITNAIVFMNDANTIVLKLVLVGVIIVTFLLIYIILASSTKIIKVLGETGNKVLMRLMGLIVMVIAVEFFFSGLKPIIQDILSGV